MTETQAQAIINEALNHNVIDKNPPDHLKTRIAERLLEQAKEAWDSGEKGAHVAAILNTASTGLIAEAQGDFPVKNLNDNPNHSDDEAKYKEAIAQTIEPGLPVPHEIEGEVLEIPLDITEIALKELRYMYGAFNACSARASWLYSYEEAGESAAEEIADHYENEYIIRADRKDIGGKAKAMALLKAEAEANNADIPKWRARQKQHARKANRYKRLLDSYNNNCERLSREMTVRMNEREHS